MFELGVMQVVGWFVGASILAAAGWVALSGQHRNPQHDRELAWFLWHWFTGGPLETTRAYPRKGGRPRRTATRTAIGVGRTLGVVAFVASVYLQSGASGSLTHAAAWSAGGAAALALGTLGVTYAAMEWSMWRHYVGPLHWAVADTACWPLDMRWWQVRRYITIRRRIDGIEVFVTCGPTFKPLDDTKKKVDQIVRAKLGLSNVLTNWPDEGRHRYCEFIRQEPVPAKVPFNDVKTLIEAESTPSRVLLGMTRGNDPVWLDLNKSPHVLISAGTGGGKSVALAGATAQLLWHGAEVVVLDIKRISHLWLRDLPNVRYSRDIGEIHRTLLDLHAEMERRTRLWDPVTAEQEWAGEVPRFPRLVVLFDEISSTMGRLRNYWADVREPGDPARSPALRAWDDILNQGRQVHMNVLAAGQRGSANAVGSGDNRENFELVAMIDRYSPKTWKMFTDAPFIPGISHAGRAQLLIGASVIETQMLWLEPRDAWRWVTDKKGSQPGVPLIRDVPIPGETSGDCPPTGTKEPVVAVTLWEASKDKGQGVVRLNFEALKKAAQRDRRKGEFPDPVRMRGTTPEFEPLDLRLWERNRVRPMASDGVAGDETNEIDGVDRVDDRENESLAEDVSDRAWLLRKLSRRDREALSLDDVRERFYAKVSARNEDGCEIWIGAINGDGYAYFKVGDKTIPAHRFAYEDQVGPIAPGLTIDHLTGPGEPCTSKLCMRGDHLEAVTRAENSARKHERDWATKLSPVLVNMEESAT